MVSKEIAVSQSIVDYFNSNFTDDDCFITADTPLRTIKKLDSIALLELILFLEEEFDLSIPDDDVTLENFHSAATIADYIAGRVASSRN